MIYKKITIIIVLIIITTSITTIIKQNYKLTNQQSIIYPIRISQSMRYLLLQYTGSIKLKIKNQNNQEIIIHQENFYQGIITENYIGKILNFEFISSSSISIGCLQLHKLHQRQYINYGQQKYIHLRKKQIRTIQIKVSSGIYLNIQRMQGIPLFISNLCKINQKKECLDQLHRFTPIQFKKHVDKISLGYCDHCIMYIRIITYSNNTKLRLSLEANITNINYYPSLFLMKKGQIRNIKIYRGQLQIGKLMFYQGQGQIISRQFEMIKFNNGYNLFSNKSLINQYENTISIKCLSQIGYFMIIFSRIQTNISLIDGLLITNIIEPNKTYNINYNKNIQGKTNIIFSSTTELMQKLIIRFVDIKTNDHHLIRPRYYFNYKSVSQNFQLQNRDDIIIELKIIGQQIGQLNITVQNSQCISLPLDFMYSSFLGYKQYDDYILQGISGNIDIYIQKCVDCTIRYEISQEPIIKKAEKLLKNISIIETHQMKSSNLYIRIETNNFAFYSLQAKKHIKSLIPILPYQDIQFYISEGQQQQLLMEFHAPLCGQKQCSKVSYYLFEGSDQKHLASKVYCSSVLFNFDQNTKDIVFQEIKPKISNKTLSYQRLFKHRDYLGVIADVDGFLLPYKVINTQEVRLYKEMRWPFFYLALFATVTVFSSFTCFMILRRRSQGGYIRISKVGTSEDLG